jgi:hypothetical protein
MIACWYKTYIRRFGEEKEKKKVTCNHRPHPKFVHVTLFTRTLLLYKTGAGEFIEHNMTGSGHWLSAKSLFFNLGC